MTVSTTANREQYATDGVTTAFTIHFPFFNDTDVNAIFVSSGGVSTTLALNTNFTVAGGATSTGVPAGGTLTTTGSPLGNGGTLTIFRGIPFTQETDYVEDDPLPANALEGDIDRAVMRDQQLKDAQDRSLSFPPTVTPDVSAELPSPQADLVLGWNATGTALENKDLTNLGVAVLADEDTAMAATSDTTVTTPLSLARAIRAAKLSAFTLSR